MIILNEENTKLIGTKYKLPKQIIDTYENILFDYSDKASMGAYRIAQNVIDNKGIVSYDWLKNMVRFFDDTKNDLEIIIGGGDTVKNYVKNKLDQIRNSSNNGKRKEHTNNPTKVRSDANQLAGNKGEKQSTNINVSKLIFGN
jgi:hypothetical protein